MDISEQEIAFPSAPNNDEFDADGVPFQPRFQLQELIFAPSKANTGMSSKGSRTASDRSLCRLAIRIGSCLSKSRPPLLKRCEIESSPPHRT